MLTRFVSLLVDVDAPRPSHAYALHSSESRYCLRDVTILLNFHLATGVVVFFFVSLHPYNWIMAAHILIVDDEPDMGHATKIKSVNSIFVATSLIISLITLCFGIYEHRREHQFRCDILHAKLQLNNYTRSDSSIRVPVIDTTGKVLFDNQKDSPALMGNHLHRKEVQDALHTGTGLGLAIVKNIALQYGGSATASETPGVG